MLNRCHCPLIGLLVALCLSSPVRAEEPEPVAQQGEAAPESAFATDEQWGWFLIGSSLALGGALTASGLIPDCKGERDCRVRNSLLVWSGVSVASLGSMFGFIILQRPDTAEPAQDSSGLVVSWVNRF